MHNVHGSEPASTPVTPPACPECGSANVSTKAKRPDADSYWRCERCGEIWNIRRRLLVRPRTWR